MPTETQKPRKPRDEEEWKAELPPEVFEVLREKARRGPGRGTKARKYAQYSVHNYGSFAWCYPGVIGLSQSLAVCFFGSAVLLPLMLHASGKFSDGGLLEWRFGFRLRTCFVVIRPRNC